MSKYGVCSECGKYGVVNKYHVKYLELDGIDEIILLCPGHHVHEHLRKKKEFPERALEIHNVSKISFEKKRYKERHVFSFFDVVNPFWYVSELISYDTNTNHIGFVTQFTKSLGNGRNKIYGINGERKK